MLRVSKSNLRRAVECFLNWRLPILVILVGFGSVLFLAGLFLLRLRLQPLAHRNNLTPAAAIDLPPPSPSISGEANYQVKPGDTLWDLAELFYGDAQLYSSLAQANNLAPNDWLMVGQTLVIPPISSIEEARMVSELRPPTVKRRLDLEFIESGYQYEVQPGDCLWSIARSQLNDPYLWVAVYEQNQVVIGDNPHLIYPGQKLTL